MIASLQEIYADAIGTEFQHIQNPRLRNWVQDRIESRPAEPSGFARRWRSRSFGCFSNRKLSKCFLHTRYVGQKRFSLQGAESLILILDTILHRCPAGRDRGNLHGNGASRPAQCAGEFSPKIAQGDLHRVQHELHSRSWSRATATSNIISVIAPSGSSASGAEIEIRLAANPSHLEAVDPVVEGIARARQRIRGDTEHRRKVLPLLIHGDAAFAGQGIVAETLNMSQLHGYSTGGTVHIVVNNQIGFTTLPEDARSSMYATDVAKMIEVPIFHVNGDDPIAVRFVTETALDFRQEFGRDVVIDMYCYRRYGHNEGDEPLFTQPDLYAKIAKRPSVAKLYKQQLLEAGVLT